MQTSAPAPLDETFKVYYQNHRYFSQDTWPTQDEALAAAKKACFEATIYRFAGGQSSPVLFWSPISGTQVYR